MPRRRDSGTSMASHRACQTRRGLSPPRAPDHGALAEDPEDEVLRERGGVALPELVVHQHPEMAQPHAASVGGARTLRDASVEVVEPRPQHGPGLAGSRHTATGAPCSSLSTPTPLSSRSTTSQEPNRSGHLVELEADDDHDRARVGGAGDRRQRVLPAHRPRQPECRAEARDRARLAVVGGDHLRGVQGRAPVCRGDLVHVARPADLVGDERADVRQGGAADAGQRDDGRASTSETPALTTSSPTATTRRARRDASQRATGTQPAAYSTARRWIG